MGPKLKVGALVVVVLGVAIGFRSQQGRIKQLTAEKADLTSQLTQMASLQEANERLAAQLKEAEAASQANLSEAARLRGQGVRLRQLEQENIQLKAQGRQLERQALAAESASADYALAPVIAERTQTLKTAIADYYGKHGALPDITDSLEPTLVSDGLLENSGSNLSNVRTRVVAASPSITLVTGANQAYSLDGGGTNNVSGRLLVEAVVRNMTAKGARELSRIMDGDSMCSPVGEADLIGRVKFDAIPAEGTGEVHIYLTHR